MFWKLRGTNISQGNKSIYFFLYYFILSYKCYGWLTKNFIFCLCVSSNPGKCRVCNCFFWVFPAKTEFSFRICPEVVRQTREEGQPAHPLDELSLHRLLDAVRGHLRLLLLRRERVRRR
jgi:hypothetical protein